MRITYDETKRLQNLAKHGMDFADVTVSFLEASVIVAAKGSRFMAVGRFRDGAIAVVFARLGSEGISVISMRPASRKERTLL